MIPLMTTIIAPSASIVSSNSSIIKKTLYLNLSPFFLLSLYDVLIINIAENNSSRIPLIIALPIRKAMINIMIKITAYATSYHLFKPTPPLW
jgi:hypothetical protein